MLLSAANLSFSGFSRPWKTSESGSRPSTTMPSAPCDVTVAIPSPLCRSKLLGDCEPRADPKKSLIAVYTTYLSPPMCFAWRVNTIYLFWTLEYQIRLLWAQM